MSNSMVKCLIKSSINKNDNNDLLFSSKCTKELDPELCHRVQATSEMLDLAATEFISTWVIEDKQ